MDCKDLQELLLAYADDELRGTQRDFIEEHLKSCVKCRITLTEYKKTRENLLNLRATTNIPDMKEKIMEEIRTMKTGFGFKRFLRPALIAVPVVIIVALVLALQPFGKSEDTSGVIARAYAATSKLSSFRYEKDDYHQDSPSEEPFHSFHAEIEYVAPDRFYISSESYTYEIPGLEGPMEQIVIGDTLYQNIPITMKLESEHFDQLELTEEKTFDYLNMLVEVETLEDEIIDGTECYHYIGEVDMEKYLESYRPTLERMYYRMDKQLPWGMTTSLEDFIEDSNTRSRTQDMTFEFWIGKDDYLLRQAKFTYETREGEVSDWNEYISFSIMRYYDLNGDITIKEPLDESGELMAGWSLYTLESLEIPDESDILDVVAEAKIPDENEVIPEELLAAATVTEKLNSYRQESTTWEYVEGKWMISRSGLSEYGGYNQYRKIITPTEEYKNSGTLMSSTLDIETILIDDQLYSRGFGRALKSTGDINSGGPTGEETRKMMEMLFDVETLPEEEINGVECYHFRGIVDTEKYLEWYRPLYIESMIEYNETQDEDQYKMDPEQSWGGMVDFQRAKETIYEYWIGKDDYVLRKRIIVDRLLEANTLPVDDLTHESTQQTISYYLNFNEPVEITAPLDDSGNLLEGWFVVTLEE
jgi:hypothetical protein